MINYITYSTAFLMFVAVYVLSITVFLRTVIEEAPAGICYGRTRHIYVCFIELS